MASVFLSLIHMHTHTVKFEHADTNADHANNTVYTKIVGKGSKVHVIFQSPLGNIRMVLEPRNLPHQEIGRLRSLLQASYFLWGYYSDSVYVLYPLKLVCNMTCGPTHYNIHCQSRRNGVLYLQYDGD